MRRTTRVAPLAAVLAVGGVLAGCGGAASSSIGSTGAGPTGAVPTTAGPIGAVSTGAAPTGSTPSTAAGTGLPALPTGQPAGDLGAADTAFGLDLLRTACAAGPSANQLLSPLSTSEALDLVYAGAHGASATALAATMHQPAYGQPLVTALAARGVSLAALDGTKDQPALTVANRAYLRQGLAIVPDWLTAIGAAQRATARTLDFAGAPEAARTTINHDVATDTGGHITQLLPPDSIKDDTAFVLTDALHLTAGWAMPFDPVGAPMPFTTAAGPTAQTPYLRSSGQLSYASAAGWQSVAVPFGGGRLEAVLMLPPTGATAACTLPDAATLGQLTAGSPRQVELSVPPLKLDVRTDLSTVLGTLGLGTLFTPAADLSGIAGRPGDLAISAVEHEATLTLDRDGIEASAATSVTGVLTAARGLDPPTATVVSLDRPWVLEIRDATTREPLFLGRIADPTRG